MTSVAHEGHLDPLAETSQGRSRQELRRMCKQDFLSYVYTVKVDAFRVHVLVSISFTTVVCVCVCVFPGDDEKLASVVKCYDCQILGRAPYHLPVTH